MGRVSIHAAVLFALLSGIAPGGDVSGRILIERSVRKKTIAAVTYDLRGANVKEAPPVQTGNEYDKIAVWLEPEKGSAPSASPVHATIQQLDRRFVPDLLIVPVGSTIDFPNADPVFHNVFSLSRTQSFDLGYYPQGHSKSIKFLKSGVVQIYCHVHPKMYAAVVVTSSPWFATPSAEGVVAWKDIPPGKYRMMAWHRVAGMFQKDVVVTESGAVSVTLSIPLDEAESQH